ncbi:MAG TPA: glycosyltransferase [Acidimicrobiia bacterium]|nr:glycosyltransferase [Acidimicrobiia bacterium]
MALQEVFVRALAPERLTALIGPERAHRFLATAAATEAGLAGRLVLNVNSTAVGGGVAEMLQTLLAYARGVGVDTRWVVVEGNPEFFGITKRVHNGLYGMPGDGGPLGADERRVYEATLHSNAAELRALVRPGDFVLLHDPQTAGLAPGLRRAGVTVVWRCHVGIDRPNGHAERAWDFLRRYLEDVDAYVFSCEQFAPPWIDRSRLEVIPPSIDPFSAKNEPMEPDEVARILQYVGLLDGGGAQPVATFTRRDGSPGRVNRHVDILQTGPPPPVEAPLVLQASRWDSLKDMRGVMEAFAEHVAPRSDAHLVLAGPAVHGVADDPEAAGILADCVQGWRRLPHAARSRIHLACVPMTDPDEAAAIVNALQRHCTIAAQKSLAEGFGLTVAEAMWKSRPVVGSAVGGIVEQIVDRESGLLVDDPTDPVAFGDALQVLLDDPAEATRLGANARTRACERFLGDRHLEQWAALLAARDVRAAASPA